MDASVNLSDETYTDNNIAEPITDRQKSYLSELVNINIFDEQERENWFSQIHGLTKNEASEAIQAFKVQAV